ncbi:MAG: class I SAM-dependent methyltransferase [Puniceicoccaceae bacterium]
MSSASHDTHGSIGAFSKNWETRSESTYTHWTRGEPQNQIQLAFRNHWTLFSEFMQDPQFNGGKRALEVGCGRGSLSCYFSDAGFDCTLVDLSPKVIEIAKSIFAANDLSATFQVADVCALPFEDASFDVLYSIGLMEHFESIEKPLSEQVRVLASGGLFIAYIVPHYDDNVQKDYHWINEVLKGYQRQGHGASVPEKDAVFRSDFGSQRYLEVLEQLPLHGIQHSGVYPLPMISHSIDFPFSLMPGESEAALVAHFQKQLEDRRVATGKHPWLCEEGMGQAFVIWGFKS